MPVARMPVTKAVDHHSCVMVAETCWLTLKRSIHRYSAAGSALRVAAQCSMAASRSTSRYAHVAHKDVRRRRVLGRLRQIRKRHLGVGEDWEE